MLVIVLLALFVNTIPLLCYTDDMVHDPRAVDPERLNETRYERNKHSWWDRLRGKEETEEEALRKKLDAELKEAARRRATDFEEERRTEEKREVAETKKLKKRWREKLVEKSRALLAETAVEDQERPQNGYEIAQRLVAERIIAYHEALNDESLDLRRSEIKALKLHIDFMGLLYEKLEQPDLEVPDEVEQLYQTIAASVEESSSAPDSDTSVSQVSQENIEPVPISEEDAAYTHFASSIVQAIRRALRPATHTSPLEPDGLTHEQPSRGRIVVTPPEQLQSTVAQPEQAPSLLVPGLVTERLLRSVKENALSIETIREELSHDETVRHLASIVERAEAIEQRRYHQTATAQKVIEVAARTRPPEPPSPQTVIEQPERLPSTDHAAPPLTEFVIPKNRKIKFMSDPELLALASLVSIGSGRRLVDAYKGGEIDRSGLIKVLESFHKGRDYKSEFFYRRSHANPPSTPERLSQVSARTQVPAASDPLLQPQAMPQSPQSFQSRQILVPSPQQRSPSALNRHVLSNLGRDIKHRLQRQNRFLLLLSSVLLLVVVAVIVIELLST